MIDIDLDGYISRGDLKQIFEQNSYYLSDEDINFIFGKYFKDE